MSCCNWPWEQSCVTPQNCINVPNNCTNSNSCSSLLLAFPGTNTCAEAMAELSKRLGKRLHTTVLVTSSGYTYTFSFATDRKRAQMSVTTASGCALPLTVSLVVNCSATHTATLIDVDQFLEWVVSVMR